MAGVGQELLNVPFGDMVQKLAFAIAEGQTKLDMNSAAVAKFMADSKIKLPPLKDGDPGEFSLLSMGFFPQFYQFQEAIIEVKMAITMATSSEFNIGAEAKLNYGAFSASVNASYSSKYDYKVEGSSLLRVRMTPVPPPAILLEYMEKLMQGKAKDSNILGAGE
jgi:hypothetical protein